MGATGTVSISGSVVGLPTGTKTFVGSIASNNAVGQITDQTLLSGDNYITIPSGTTAVLIQPPAGNTAHLKLKGDPADVGIELHPTDPTLLSLKADIPFIMINASALMALATEFSFI